MSITMVNITPIHKKVDVKKFSIMAPLKKEECLVAMASIVVDDDFYCGFIGIYAHPDGKYSIKYPTINLAICISTYTVPQGQCLADKSHKP